MVAPLPPGDSTLLLWQLADSAFPAGGFAHSGGLEAAVQLGEIRDEREMGQFLRHCLTQAGHATLPLVTGAHGDPELLAELDGVADLLLRNPIANRASRLQGRAWLTATAAAFPHAQLHRWQDAAREGRLYGHQAPIIGATARILGVELVPAQRLFLFLVTRSLTSAAVRLGTLGSYEAQRMQAEVAPYLDEILRSCSSLGPDDITQTAPLVELWQSAHDRLYSRLFQS